jgi:phage terminase small subunit
LLGIGSIWRLKVILVLGEYLYKVEAVQEANKILIELEKKLTAKQLLFAKEYVLDFNATRAATSAGYSEKTAQSIGAENLTKPLLQEYITLLIQPKLDELDVSKERILNEYAKIAFLNPKDLYDADGNLLEIHEMRDEIAAAISEINVDTIYGDFPMIKRKFKLNNKLSALNDLARYRKLLTDKTEVDQLNTNVNIPLSDISDPEAVRNRVLDKLK